MRRTMRTLLYTAAVAYCFICVLASDVVLKPQGGQTAVAMVVLPRNGIQPAAYTPVMTAIQSSSASSGVAVWVGIGSGAPGASVPRLLSSLSAAGMPASAPVFLTSHSPQSAAAATAFVAAGNVTVSGAVFMAGFLPRAQRGAAGSRVFTVPFLTLAGELDGVSRLTRNGAEAYYAQQSASGAADFPVVVVEGANHMSFASGSPPADVLARDLVATASSSDAQSATATAVASFLHVHAAGGDGGALRSAVAASSTILQPIIDAMQQSGNRRVAPACDSDFPTNPTCKYPKYPNKSLPPGPSPAPNPLPPSDCMCGSSFVANVASPSMTGFAHSPLPTATSVSNDAFHDVSDTHPFHLPNIWNSCGGSAPCQLNTTTVTMPIYVDGTTDDGIAPLSALELRTKLKSREAVWDAAGLKVVKANDTDGGLDHCMAINNASWQWALQHASPSALARFRAVGEPYVMVKDFEAPIGITGPQWIKTEMRYTRTPADGTGTVSTVVNVQSITFVVPNINKGKLPWYVPVGMHYCKILSPFRAMEWITVDGLRQYGSLANATTTTTPTSLPPSRSAAAPPLAAQPEVLHVATPLSKPDVILKPVNSTSGPVAGLVWCQGASIPATAYKSLFQLVQSVFPGQLWVVIPAFPGEIVEPVVLGSGMTRGIKDLKDAGMPANAPLFVGGHSLGGAMVPTWTNSDGKKDGVVGQVLMGAFLTRKYRDAYPIPTLALGGELDGLARCTRFAEEYYHRILHAPNPSTAVTTFPVIVLEGVTHMQFASGTPPALVKDRDLKPEVTYDQAHATIAKVTVAYLKQLLGDSSGVPLLQQHSAATGTFVQPILASMQLEGSKYLKPVCYKATPGCVNGCPYTPSPNCSINNTWVQQAQTSVGGASMGVSYAVHDEYRPVDQVVPLYSPSVANHCSAPAGCTLSVTTYSDLTFDALSSLDTGYTSESATAIRAKLVSRQWVETAAGVSGASFNTTDGPGTNLCAAANKLAYQWALSAAGSKTASRFSALGVPMSMGADITHASGATWLTDHVHYDNSSVNTLVVTSPSLATSLDYPKASYRGFHFCQLLSPARALEWMYVDGLRTHDGIKTR